MKTTPMLLTPAMAHAWAEGRKTRTQRVIKPQPDLEHSRTYKMQLDGRLLKWGRPVGRHDPHNFYVDGTVLCPYGQPGDRLQLLTTWAVLRQYDKLKPTDIPIDILNAEPWTYFDSPDKPDWCGKLRPGRFMPKWMRKLMPRPKIVSIEARRIQEITFNECLEEGIYPDSCFNNGKLWNDADDFTVDAFRNLWDSINSKYPWKSNPWVWSIEFERSMKFNSRLSLVIDQTWIA